MTVITLTSGTSWTVPADWSTTNTIEVYGAGASGGASGDSSGNSIAGGGGGGGGSGSYAKNTNQTGLSGSIPYSIGVGGSAVTSFGGNPGGDTNFNSGQVIGKGGSGGGVGSDAPATAGGSAGAGGILGTGTTRTVGANGTVGTDSGGGASAAGGPGGVGTGSFGNGGKGGDGAQFSVAGASTAGVNGRIVITYTPAATGFVPYTQTSQLGPILAS